ncbi:hypothetical protein [Kitasatospora phosalacinea]|nr:hypothetical protein [Kitasatospora phosalacinea]
MSSSASGRTAAAPDKAAAVHRRDTDERARDAYRDEYEGAATDW